MLIGFILVVWLPVYLMMLYALWADKTIKDRKGMYIFTAIYYLLFILAFLKIGLI